MTLRLDEELEHYTAMSYDLIFAWDEEPVDEKIGEPLLSAP